MAKRLHKESHELDIPDLEIQNDKTLHGVIKGTPGYMAPEQINKGLGESDHFCDIYALGGILYELLCSEIPNQGKDLDDVLRNTLDGVQKKPSKINSNVPVSLESIAMKSLSVRKEDRYNSVKEIIEDIKKFQGGFITSAEQGSFLKSLFYLFKRHKLVSVLIGLLVISSIVFTLQVYQEKLQVSREKQRAESQKVIAIEQKEKAENAFQLFKTAQNERNTISKKASPRLLSVGLKDLTGFNFDSARENIQLAVLWKPENRDAQISRACFLFITQKFTQAVQVFDNLENRDRHLQKIYDLAQKYASIKQEDDLFLDTKTMKEFLKDCKKIYNLPISSQNTIRFMLNIVNYAYLQDFYSTEDKIELAYFAMVNTNPLGSNWELKWNTNNSKIDIDLSNNKSIFSVKALHSLPLRKLNLANSSIKNIEGLFGSSVSELDIRNCRINGSDLKALKNLKSLKLNKTQSPMLRLRGVEIIRQ